MNLQEQISRIKSMINVLCETESNNILYHFVDNNGFKINLKNQGFIFHSTVFEDIDNLKYESGLSTTRLYNLDWSNIRFNLNKDYISTKYSIKPVHWFNKSDKPKIDYRTLGSKQKISQLGSHGLPINQYEETILSKDLFHIMPLNKNTVYSVDILINSLDDKNQFKKIYEDELIKLTYLGIKYNFVNKFTPFKNIEHIEDSKTNQAVIKTIRLADENEMINYLSKRDDIREILSDVRVIVFACSHRYKKLLNLMIDMDINLGINDFVEIHSKNMFTNRNDKNRIEDDNFIAIRASKNNKDVLSILMRSRHIPIDIKYSIIIKHELFKNLEIIYNSDIENNRKSMLAIKTNDYKNFDKFFDNSVNKIFLCKIINNKKNIDKQFIDRCLSYFD